MAEDHQLSLSQPPYPYLHGNPISITKLLHTLIDASHFTLGYGVHKTKHAKLKLFGPFNQGQNNFEQPQPRPYSLDHQTTRTSSSQDQTTQTNPSQDQTTPISPSNRRQLRPTQQSHPRLNNSDQTQPRPNISDHTIQGQTNQINPSQDQTT